jgi:hypothetical protein
MRIVLKNGFKTKWKFWFKIVNFQKRWVRSFVDIWVYGAFYEPQKKQVGKEEKIWFMNLLMAGEEYLRCTDFLIRR